MKIKTRPSLNGFALGIFFFVLLLSSCNKDEHTPSPTITGFSPTSGLASSSSVGGETVVISGKNFSATSTSIKFNGTEAVVLSATPTQLITIVPEGALTGRITVTVNGRTATSADDFTVLALHTITSFSPASGVVGSQVTIAGTGFSLTKTNNVIEFNGIPASVTEASATTLTVTVPSGATTGKIKIVINGNGVSSVADFVIPSPTITAFTPEYALPGASITLTGTNFAQGNLTLNKVKVNGVDAVVTAATDAQLIVTVPTGATTGKISVDVGGQAITSATNLEILKDIPRAGLIAFYPFNGNANDASGNALHGNLINSPTPSADRFGTPNQAYSFDGISNYINMGNPTALQISNKITVSVWINCSTFDDAINGIVHHILSKQTANSSVPKGYRLAQSFYNSYSFSSEYVCGSTSPGGQYHSFQNPGASLTLNNWFHLVLIIDDKALNFYQNGVNVGISIASQFQENILADGSTGNLLIGATTILSPTPNRFFNGIIDDVIIYNRALSAAEITQLYEQTVTKY